MRLLPIVGIGLLAACNQASSSPEESQAEDAVLALGTVTNVVNLAACPSGAPSGATCKRVTVGGCPGIETETLDATVAFWPAPATLKGTVVHFSGSGGTGYQIGGAQQYQT